MSRVKEAVRGYSGVDDEQQKGCQGDVVKEWKNDDDGKF